MLKGDYPEHDMNKVFDMVYQTIEAGGTDDKCKDEADFLMHLFAGLPAEAVEYGMMFLHGKTDLPAAAQEIMPLYVRLMNLLEYCEKVESLRTIPETMSTEDIMARRYLMTLPIVLLASKKSLWRKQGKRHYRR